MARSLPSAPIQSEQGPLMLILKHSRRKAAKLVQSPLMTETDHFPDENGLLLVVEAAE
jgi:hypothetical protein